MFSYWARFPGEAEVVPTRSQRREQDYLKILVCFPVVFDPSLLDFSSQTPRILSD